MLYTTYRHPSSCFFTVIMVFRPSRMGLHVPLIRFTYALRKSGAAAAAAPPAVSSALAAGSSAGASETAVSSLTSVMVDFFDELPTYMRPHVYTQEEIEMIEMGGLRSYGNDTRGKKKAK